jgi:chaperonin cofactor prefoldin
MAIVKVENTTYVRDTHTMALINTDISGLEDYKMKSRLLTNQKNEINKVKNEINDIKDDVKIIKELLMQLSSRKE